MRFKAEPDRPLAMSPVGVRGKPEVSQNLDDPFRGLSLGIKFQGTTAKAISDKLGSSEFSDPWRVFSVDDRRIGVDLPQRQQASGAGAFEV